MYKVRACLCTNFIGVMDTLETDNFYEVQDFIWNNCQKGFSCELTDTTTGKVNWAYADSFNEDTVDVDELIMEQNEQG